VADPIDLDDREYTMPEDPSFAPPRPCAVTPGLAPSEPCWYKNREVRKGDWCTMRQRDHRCDDCVLNREPP
jgi:hypothetical protein